MQYSHEHLKTMVYANFGGQTECIMGNSKIENNRRLYMATKASECVPTDKKILSKLMYSLHLTSVPKVANLERIAK